MKDLFGCIFSLILGLILQYLFPWWTVFFTGIPSVLLLHTSFSKSFWFSFMAIILPWLLIPLFIDFANEHILLRRIQSLFMDIPGFMLQFIIAVLVASIGGIGAQFAYFLKLKFK